MQLKPFADVSTLCISTSPIERVRIARSLNEELGSRMPAAAMKGASSSGESHPVKSNRWHTSAAKVDFDDI
jgi:hypothetical protein